MFQTTGKALWSAYENLSLKVKQYRQSYEGDEDPVFGWVTEPSSPTYHALNGRDSWLEEDAGHLQADLARDELEQRSAQDANELAESPQPLPPEPLHAGNYQPELSEPSSILSDKDFRALADAIPIRHKWRYWRLLYSSGRDGISLTTLYRKGSGVAPCILVIRDRGHFVFGCYAAEQWKVAPRYYGNGESFVFQLQPKFVHWKWWQQRMNLARNDFFQFGRPDCLAMGGAPRYAISLDNELLRGSSGLSDSFGSPCLASQEDFEIGRVELWGLI